MRRSFAFVRAATVTAMSSAYANAQQFVWAVAAGALLMSVIAAPATAAPLVSWRIIHGVVVAGDDVGGVFGDGNLWTNMSGSATVDMGSGTVQFNVVGLTVAQGKTIGTTDDGGLVGTVTSVHGAVGCTVGAVSASSFTQPVPLSPQGDASSGILPISIPLQCTPSNVSFLITILVSGPGGGFEVYIAFGASRFTH
jgi:hypothetical protein